jgi:hypothetical protein
LLRPMAGHPIDTLQALTFNLRAFLVKKKAGRTMGASRF